MHELHADALVARVAAVNHDRIAIVVDDVVATFYPAADALKRGDGHDLHPTFPKQRMAILRCATVLVDRWRYFRRCTVLRSETCAMGVAHHVTPPMGRIPTWNGDITSCIKFISPHPQRGGAFRAAEFEEEHESYMATSQYGILGIYSLLTVFTEGRHLLRTTYGFLDAL
jgi:hypothetical protein